MKFNASKNKSARQLTYKVVIGVLPILQRFGHSLGLSDIDDIALVINNMSVDEFCDFKFNDDLIEGD